MDLNFASPIASSKREVKPNGFVLFKDVSIARVGEQLYHPSEIDGSPEPASDGAIHIIKTADELFKPETVLAWEGTTLTNNHPEKDINQVNFREEIVGVILNPHPGKGVQSNDLVADVLVMDKDAIADIDSGKRELSCGYGAQLYMAGNGIGYHRQIVPNHVSLVESGRCGSTCALRDKKFKGDTPVPKKGSFSDTLKHFFSTRDEVGLGKFLDEMKSEDDPMDPMEKRMKAVEDSMRRRVKDDDGDDDPQESRFAALEAAVQQINQSVSALTDRFKTQDDDSAAAKIEAEKKAREDSIGNDDLDKADYPDEVEDDLRDAVKTARDSAMLAPAFAAIRSKAEIIAPGVAIPTFTKDAKPKQTFKDCLCKLRRDSLETAARDGATAATVNMVAGRSIKPEAFRTMDSKAVRTIFNGVAAVKAAENSRRVTDASGTRAAYAPELSRAEQVAARYTNTWKSR